MLYLTLKSIHIIAVISWMAGMLYLPRLFAYHSENKKRKDICSLFCTMERRLLKIIMNPAMIVTFITGFWLIFDGTAVEWSDGWLHTKLLLVFFMGAVHAYFSRCRKQLEAGLNKHSSKFFRLINEVPTILIILIVLLVVFKPW